MVKRILLLLVCSFSIDAFSLDYEAYHTRFNACLEQFSKSDFGTVADSMVGIFGNFRPFARDVFVALEIAAYEKNLEAFQSLVISGASVGLTPDHIDQKIISNFIATYHLEAFCDSARKANAPAYLDSLDKQFRKRLIYNYKREQEARSATVSFYRKVVSDNFDSIRNYTVRVGFPSEHRVGIDHCGWMKSRDSKCLGNSKVVVTMLHQPFAFSLLKDQLVIALHEGHLHPRDFAYIFSMECARTSKLYGDVEPCHSDWTFNYGFQAKSDDLEEVNRDRVSIGLVTLEVHEALKSMQRSTGIDFRL